WLRRHRGAVRFPCIVFLPNLPRFVRGIFCVMKIMTRWPLARGAKIRERPAWWPVTRRHPIGRDCGLASALPIERRSHRVRRRIVLFDARGELGISSVQRDSAQRHRLCAVPSFLEIGPRQARSGYWRAQVIAAVVLQHYAGKRQPVLVVERQVANAGITPPPLAETVMGRRVALEAEFNPRFIGTSWGVIYKTGLREGVATRKLENMRETAIFGCADLVAAFEALGVPFAPHRLFANQASRPVEARMTTGGAECVMLILNRRR